MKSFGTPQLTEQWTYATRHTGFIGSPNQGTEHYTYHFFRTFYKCTLSPILRYDFLRFLGFTLLKLFLLVL